MNALFEKPRYTISEFITAVFTVTNETEAQQFAADYVAWLSKCNDLTHPAEEIMRANIGWCFGEGMSDDKIYMWRKVCNASHPWFGTTIPNAERCLAIGKAMAVKK